MAVVGVVAAAVAGVAAVGEAADAGVVDVAAAVAFPQEDGEAGGAVDEGSVGVVGLRLPSAGGIHSGRLWLSIALFRLN